MQAGKIYIEIAERVLRKKYPDKMDELLHDGSFSEVEAFAEIKEYIEAVCCAVRHILEPAAVYLPKDFASYVLWSETPETDLQSSRFVSIANGFREECKGEIAYRALSMAHDVWVQRNETLFFDEKHLNQRFLFLRAEMIGYGALSEFMDYVEPILSIIGLMPRSEQFVKEYYRSATRRMKDFYNIRNTEDLKYLIRRGDYRPLTAMIANAMSNDSTAAELAEQAMLKMAG